MPLWSKRLVVAALVLFSFVGARTAKAALQAQQPAPADAAQAPAAGTSTQPSSRVAPRPLPKPYPAEQQPPLNVDRDPVASPDPDAPSAPKQGELERGAHGGYTLHRDVEEVVLNVTVLDGTHLVTTLDKSAFSLTEDGVPQTIASFQHEDIPVSMGILVDNSGSMQDKRQAVNAAALDLVKASNAQDEAFIVNFSDEAYIDQDFTSDINKLRDGLSRIESKGGTALYDAVVASADQLSQNAKRPKQVLLIITDGEDNSSTVSLEDTIRRIQELQGPVVYSIGLLFGDSGGRESRRARRALQLLSDETGGIAFFPKSLGEVDEIAAEVARDIRSQYTIGYHSTKPSSQGGYRIVKVKAQAKGMNKLTVRTRPGYYPKGAGADKTAGVHGK